MKKLEAAGEQLVPIEHAERAQIARELLTDGTAVTRKRLTALGQAKIEYCRFSLDLARRHGAKVFATIVTREAQRPECSNALRKITRSRLSGLTISEWPARRSDGLSGV